VSAETAPTALTGCPTAIDLDDTTVSNENGLSVGARHSVCDLDFEDRYGDMGKDFIHVHHLKELSSVGPGYEVDPIDDLRPVCPNCHAMLHKRRPAFTPDELRRILRRSPAESR
jgi:predicted HNH restriction endonuclease